MDKLRVLIADDELPARNKMMRLLQDIENIELVNVSTNGLDALANINLLKPDVIFLDIEMPGLNGLEVVMNLPEGYAPFIVFATAYNEHAIKAFELNAIDYLLKPFSEDRLKQALDKISKSLPVKPEEQAEKFEQIAEQLEMQAFNKIPVPAADRYKLIDYDDVVCLEVSEKITHIFTMNKEYEVTLPLENFEKKLPASQFLRVNRSCIVNLQAVQEIVFWFGNRYKIILSNKKEVISSRERSKLLKQLLKFN